VAWVSNCLQRLGLGTQLSYTFPKFYIRSCNVLTVKIFTYSHRARSSGVASYGTMGHLRPPSTSSNFIFGSLWNKSDSQLSKYCAVCDAGADANNSQLFRVSISTALLTKLLVIEQLLHPALKFTVSAP